MYIHFLFKTITYEAPRLLKTQMKYFDLTLIYHLRVCRGIIRRILGHRCQSADNLAQYTDISSNHGMGSCVFIFARAIICDSVY